VVQGRYPGGHRKPLLSGLAPGQGEESKEKVKE
jgi:hypothetical protein